MRHSIITNGKNVVAATLANRIKAMPKELRNLANSRYYAYKAYPGYRLFQEKLTDVETILYRCRNLEFQSDREIAYTIILLEKSLRNLAPRATSKLYNSYINKIDEILKVCHELLARQKQR